MNLLHEPHPAGDRDSDGQGSMRTVFPSRRSDADAACEIMDKAVG